jgi:hypothetical protein
MHVKNLLGTLAKRLHKRKTERDIWYKNTIHNIYVYPLSLRAIKHLHIAVEVSEVG